MIVLFTVGLSIPLKEVPGSDLLLAVGADEVLWVPRLPHGGHDLRREAGYCSGTRSATKHPPREAKVPCPPAAPSPAPLPHHHLPRDGFLAGPADPLGDRGDPQFVQVRLQAPQHAVKLAPRLWGPSRGRAAPCLPLGHELWREGRGQVRTSGPWGWGSQHQGLSPLLDRRADGGRKCSPSRGFRSPQGGSGICKTFWCQRGSRWA